MCLWSHHADYVSDTRLLVNLAPMFMHIILQRSSNSFVTLIDALQYFSLLCFMRIGVVVCVCRSSKQDSSNPSRNFASLAKLDASSAELMQLINKRLASVRCRVLITIT